MGDDVTLRRRKVADVEEEDPLISGVFRRVDLFPKMIDEVKEQTASGGGFSLLVVLIITVLATLEMYSLLYNTQIIYRYSVDADYNQKVRITLDMTVAMDCNEIGADVVDEADSTMVPSESSLQFDAVSWQLTGAAKHRWDTLSRLRLSIAEQHQELHEFAWKQGFNAKEFLNLLPGLRGDEQKPEKTGDSCRIHGSMVVNKVGGNLHVIVGKSMNFLGGGHAHIQFGEPGKMNFSHRIDHLSFGEVVPGIVNPLEGEEKVCTTDRDAVQYFLGVIPTRVSTSHGSANSFMYSVTENWATVNHAEGNHGIPGIFFKYEFYPLTVSVTEESQPLWRFLVSLCAIIGGIWSTSGFLHTVVQAVYSCVSCAYNPRVLPSTSQPNTPR